MSEKDEKKDPEGQVLPAREVMSLISPGAASVPGLGSLLGGDPTGAAPAPAGGASDLASHAADGHASDAPSVSDQPQDLSSSSTHTASSET